MALAAGLLTMVGCHSYTSVESPAPGTIARVTIPIRAAINVPNARPGTASVEGVVLSAGDTIVLAMRGRGEWGEARETTRIDTVRIARDQRSAIDLKEFSMGRSVLLSAAIAGAVTVIALTLNAVSNQDGVTPIEDVLFPPGGTIISIPVASVIAKLFGGG